MTEIFKMNSSYKLEFYSEPLLEFAHSQKSDYCKDGLFLYGPLKNKVEISYGVIGHEEGIKRFEKWISEINSYISSADSKKLHFSSYPGFKSIFNTKLKPIDNAKIYVDKNTILNKIKQDNINKAIYETVNLYREKLIHYKNNEEELPNIWFVIIPEEVHHYGRSKSVVPKKERIKSNVLYTKKMKLSDTPGQVKFFPEMNEQAKVYDYGTDFRRQLKARLLKEKIPIQIIRETSIAPNDFLDSRNQPTRDVQDPATIAWNLSTTMMFKAGCKPWKLANIRKGVCYIGLVFKKLDKYNRSGNACCGAQMFLDTGDGLVFKGAIGNWLDKTNNEFHLTKDKAKDLMKNILEEYRRGQGEYPKELFIHGRTYFNNAEWDGFLEAAQNTTTKLIGIRITRSTNELKLYRLDGNRPIVRGTAFKVSNNKAYLWTSGYVERFNTYPGFSVPNPITIEICRGDEELDTVIKDIFALTKINFNSCAFGDSVPVTLKFADVVGNILTAAPNEDVPPLPFIYYI